MLCLVDGVTFVNAAGGEEEVEDVAIDEAKETTDARADVESPEERHTDSAFEEADDNEDTAVEVEALVVSVFSSPTEEPCCCCCCCCWALLLLEAADHEKRRFFQPLPSLFTFEDCPEKPSNALLICKECLSLPCFFASLELGLELELKLELELELARWESTSVCELRRLCVRMLLVLLVLFLLAFFLLFRRPAKV